MLQSCAQASDEGGQLSKHLLFSSVPLSEVRNIPALDKMTRNYIDLFSLSWPQSCNSIHVFMLFTHKTEIILYITFYLFYFVNKIAIVFKIFPW